MWEHNCKVERTVMMVEDGKECNWCGRELRDETSEFGKLGPNEFPDDELETKHKLEVDLYKMRIIDLETELSMIRERYDSLTGKLRKISNDKRNNVDNGDDFLRNYGSSGIARSWK